MRTPRRGRGFLPILIIFFVATAVLTIVPGIEFLWGMSRTVMLVGNVILLVATAVSFSLCSRSFYTPQPQASIRMIYTGMFAKLMICLFSALIYIFIARKHVSKGAIFGLMFLYFLYTFVEISIILKLSRKDRHVKERGAA